MSKSIIPLTKSIAGEWELLRGRNISGAQSLALIDTACKALAKAKKIGDVIEIRNDTHVLAVYLKRKEGAEEAASLALEISLRAERRIGELTREMDQAKPPGKKIPNGLVAKSKKATLKAAGLSEMDASRAEAIASISPVEFEFALQEENVSKAQLIRLGRRRYVPEPAQEPKPLRTNPDAKWVHGLGEFLERKASKYKEKSRGRKALLKLAQLSLDTSVILAKEQRDGSPTLGSSLTVPPITGPLTVPTQGGFRRKHG